MKKLALNIGKFLERYIPMTISSLILFLFVIYLIVVVSRTVIFNYHSNQSIAKEDTKLSEIETQIHDIENQINYFQTYSFKEKEARAKLGYKAPGENVISLPIDKEDEKSAYSGIMESAIKIPNYRLWWQYFFQSNRGL